MRPDCRLRHREMRVTTPPPPTRRRPHVTRTCEIETSCGSLIRISAKIAAESTWPHTLARSAVLSRTTSAIPVPHTPPPVANIRRHPPATSELGRRRRPQYLLNRLAAHDTNRPRPVKDLIRTFDAHGHMTAWHQQSRARLLQTDRAWLEILRGRRGDRVGDGHGGLAHAVLVRASRVGLPARGSRSGELLPNPAPRKSSDRLGTGRKTSANAHGGR